VLGSPFAICFIRVKCQSTGADLIIAFLYHAMGSAQTI